jgi:predicted Rdx family selenoprotein
MISTGEVGVRPCSGGAFNVSIDTSQALTVPTAAQRAANGGVLWCEITIEGTATWRYRWDGTAPTAAVGLIGVAPTATTPQRIVIVGEVMIAAFRIIGTAAGDTISYAFYQTNIKE